MKVLVTGALGNVGEHTLDALLAEGHDVVAFDVEAPRARRIASQLDARVRLVWGDITDPASLGAARFSTSNTFRIASEVPTMPSRATGSSAAGRSARSCWMRSRRRTMSSL